MAAHVSPHPLVQDKLTRLRDRDTPPPEFRRLVQDLSRLLFLEAAADLPTLPHEIHTPLMPCTGRRLAWRIGLIPVLRAGLGMAEAILDMVPEAQVHHLGLYRDHDTLQPVAYYSKLTGPPSIDIGYVLDPMLATGGSALAALDLLKRWGLTRLRYIGLIAAPEGVANLGQAHPDVSLYLGAIDHKLNEVGYIVPGLGDAGDRQFAT